MLTMCACQVTEFVRERVLPIEQELRDYYEEEDWTIPAKHQQLQQEAKAAGLWNLFLPLETDPEAKFGAGLTNLEYAHLCEVPLSFFICTVNPSFHRHHYDFFYCKRYLCKNKGN